MADTDATAPLTLLPGGVDIQAAETLALRRAVNDIGGWISCLPASSEWSWAFRRMRACLLEDLDYRGGAVMAARRSHGTGGFVHPRGDRAGRVRDGDGSRVRVYRGVDLRSETRSAR